MNVGWVHKGSRYVAESLSRRRGRVGYVGIVIPFLSKRARNCVVASSGLERSGRDSPSASSSAGMNLIRLKGVEKSISSCGNVVYFVSLRF